MDRLARLIFAVLVWAAASSVWAYGEVGKASSWNCSLGGGGASPLEACGSALTAKGQSQYASPYYQPISVGAPVCGGYGPSDNSVQCSVDVSTAQGRQTVSAGAARVIACPSGSAPVAGSSTRCECSLGTAPGTGGKCQPYICPSPGSFNPITTPDQKVANVGPMCVNGCVANPASVKGAADGTLWATWPLKYTGGQCGGDVANGVATGTTSKGDAPTPCGANMCPGTVNGTSVCVACKDTTIPGPSQSASAPTGTTPAPIDGVPGAVSATKETKCTQSDCTTTTTYRDASGAVVGTKSDTKEQLSFCKENPDAPICKRGSFGGACAATTCDGDPVQCAVAQEVYKRNCELFDTKTPLSEAGVAAASGEASPSGHPGAAPDVMSMDLSARLNSTPIFGGSGGCPADMSIAMGAASVTLPFSKMCGVLTILGQIITGLSYLFAAFIVFRK
nr:virulence factor TspB C-terminal domain-related protein [uncultured Roseateles sp.]